MHADASGWGMCLHITRVQKKKNIQLLQISMLHLQAMPACENPLHRSRLF